MKMLLAADGSAYTQLAVDYLATRDWLREGNEVTVFTAVIPVPHRAAAFAGPALTQRYYDDDAEQVLRPIRERLKDSGCKIEYSHVVGHIAASIVAAAQTGGFDLIVMGSHGHGALANVVMGSVATQVLATCRIPVLLIR